MPIDIIDHRSKKPLEVASLYLNDDTTVIEVKPQFPITVCIIQSDCIRLVDIFERFDTEDFTHFKECYKSLRSQQPGEDPYVLIESALHKIGIDDFNVRRPDYIGEL